MKTHLLIPLLALALASSAVAQPRIVTVTLTARNQAETVSVESFESLKILSARDFTSGMSAALFINKPPANMHCSIPHTDLAYAPPVPGVNFPEGLTIAGPASITIQDLNSGGRSGSSPVVVTLEISPIAYPVTNTVSIGPAAGAQVTLQGSTNLVNWTPATNGYYTNMTENSKFFRILLDRVK